MTAAIKQLCALAVLSGAIMSLMPEGGVKRMAAIGCTAALLLTLVGAFRGIEAESFTLELARYRELEAELTANAGQARDRLDRSVIEAEYEAYICDEAKRLGITGLHAEVTARWDLGGLWLPHEVRLTGVSEETARRLLTGRIEAELGVPAERIKWEHEG